MFLQGLQAGDRRPAGTGDLILEHAGVLLVVSTISAAPSTVCAASAVATSRGRPMRTPPSLRASIIT